MSGSQLAPKRRGMMRPGSRRGDLCIKRDLPPARGSDTAIGLRQSGLQDQRGGGVEGGAVGNLGEVG